MQPQLKITLENIRHGVGEHKVLHMKTLKSGFQNPISFPLSPPPPGLFTAQKILARRMGLF